MDCTFRSSLANIYGILACICFMKGDYSPGADEITDSNFWLKHLAIFHLN